MVSTLQLVLSTSCDCAIGLDGHCAENALRADRSCKQVGRKTAHKWPQAVAMEACVLYKLSIVQSNGVMSKRGLSHNTKFEFTTFLLGRTKNCPSPVNESWSLRLAMRSEEHTSELQSLMRISDA